eukprot:TRINITY_DN38337_c0_g1_i1.p1 TRINITY_DN38337_c0_g1~~TRINITY_DN38337_c0_g1_i1.p1  ORF type:complete len:420 (+),score=-0.87 TRINITY_DN38337_c0_g1_i1:36-1295(+)
MRVHDIVELRGLEGEDWAQWNGRSGVLQWRDAQQGTVVLTEDDTLTAPLRNLRSSRVSVAPGAPVCAVGLTATDWRALNNVSGVVSGAIDRLGRVPVVFAAPWGTVPLLLRNLANVTPGRVLKDHMDAASVDHTGLALMFKEGALVEVHGLKTAQWAPLNGITGVVRGPIVQEVDTFRVPVAFMDPWGDLPMLVSNLRPAPQTKYVTLQSGSDTTQGLTLEGTRVVNVRTRSPAAEAGVVAGEVLRAVSNVPVFQSHEAIDALGRSPGTAIVLTLQTASKWSSEHPGTRSVASPRHLPGGTLIQADESSLRKASVRCRDCGGAVDLERRCPKTGDVHQTATPRRTREHTKPTISPMSRRTTESTLLTQLANEIQRIDDTTPVRRIPPPPVITPPPDPLATFASAEPLPSPQTGRPLFLL